MRHKPFTTGIVFLLILVLMASGSAYSQSIRLFGNLGYAQLGISTETSTVGYFVDPWASEPEQLTVTVEGSSPARALGGGLQYNFFGAFGIRAFAEQISQPTTLSLTAKVRGTTTSTDEAIISADLTANTKLTGLAGALAYDFSVKDALITVFGGLGYYTLNATGSLDISAEGYYYEYDYYYDSYYREYYKYTDKPEVTFTTDPAVGFLIGAEAVGSLSEALKLQITASYRNASFTSGEFKVSLSEGSGFTQELEDIDLSVSGFAVTAGLTYCF